MSSLFGTKKPKVEKPIKVNTAVEQSQAEKDRVVNDAEQRRRRAQLGSSLLFGQTAASSDAPVTKKTLLGG